MQLMPMHPSCLGEPAMQMHPRSLERSEQRLERHEANAGSERQAMLSKAGVPNSRCAMSEYHTAFDKVTPFSLRAMV